MNECSGTLTVTRGTLLYILLGNVDSNVHSIWSGHRHSDISFSAADYFILVPFAQLKI